MSSGYFPPQFRSFRIATGGAVLNGVIAGSGPPLLLLHGWPQTLIEWRLVAPILAERFTVVATDLRGYGDSSKPPAGEHHAGYSKRAMAQDQLQLMQQLGFQRYAVVGHDRGGRVAHRMALDQPQAVSRLAVLDIVPSTTLYASLTKELATLYFHWFLLSQPAPLPETLLAGAAEFFLRNWVFRGLVPSVLSEQVLSEYVRCFAAADTLHAMCEDYRAGAGIDLQHDAADAAATLRCPTLVLWGARGVMHRLYDVLETWRPRTTSVSGRALPAGHWLPEECPGELCAALLDFLA